MKFETDANIVLECLHEAYDMEGDMVLSGKSIYTTMIYPFIKMLETYVVGITAEELHKKLWQVYKADGSKNHFLSKAQMIIKPYYQVDSDNLEMLNAV